MASIFKYLSDHDRVVVSNELVQNITNGPSGNAGGVQLWVTSSYAPHYFLQAASGTQPYPISTHVLDVTFGRSSANLSSSTSDYEAEKSIYNQFAKILIGHDQNGNIKKFNLQPNDVSGNKVIHNAYFINFSRTQFKDKIKKGSFSMQVDVSGGVAGTYLKDSGTTVYESPCGEYAQLYLNNNYGSAITSTSEPQGLLFYEAGVAVVSPYIFSKYSASYSTPTGSEVYINNNALGILNVAPMNLSGAYDIGELITSGSLLDNNSSILKRIVRVDYQSTTELNSTVYFCRAYNHEFNYSSNPTYLQNSKIVVKGDDPQIPPRTYITTVGLYSDDNQLLAVAKLSEPVLKTTDNELIAKVRLDF